ncbi:hypothetical protein N836_24170 [Leptolyngbya sp. Heron Island J]|uniref:hypothetical protein n=1 Tax=Leptolyngbya sp. Heron Island J TaxID=1385935 RepID=UPI0003B940DE|nr:hypothetical protein [Leptolyngbya sp. Heron Island J]ESA32887.1 hypothetical protein N836_24170 [Leptolyngbya sp. Heron Island J]
MPVRVDIPIRIHVDPGALTERRSDVEDALTAAVGRALKNSRDVVLAERGGYVGIKVHPPEVVWAGNGLGKVSEAIRVEIEERIGGLLDQAVVTARIYEFAKAKESVAQVLPGEFKEPFVQERFDPNFEVYELPVYRRQGENRSLPLTQKKKNTSRKNILKPSLTPQKLIDVFTERWLLGIRVLRVRSLASYLLQLIKSSLSNCSYVRTVISKLVDDSLQDNVSFFFANYASDKTLEKLAKDGEGKKLLDTLEKAIKPSIFGNKEKDQLMRIKVIRELTRSSFSYPKKFFIKVKDQSSSGNKHLIVTEYPKLLGWYLMKLIRANLITYKYIALEFINKLAVAEQKNEVYLGLISEASQEELFKMAKDQEGQDFLACGYDELTYAASPDSMAQAQRILMARGSTTSYTQALEQLYGNKRKRAWIFPFNLPGPTKGGIFPTKSSTDIQVKRLEKGKIWVKYPQALNPKGRYAEYPELMLAPDEIFSNTGTVLDANEWIRIKLYDEGGIIVERPALSLIELHNLQEQTRWDKIKALAAFIAPMVAFSGPVIAGATARSAGGSISKTLLQKISTRLLGVERAVIAARFGKEALAFLDAFAIRCAASLFTLSMVINDHRGWIIKKLGPKWGLEYIQGVNRLGFFVGTYGLARLSGGALNRRGLNVLGGMSDSIKASWQRLKNSRKFKQLEGSDLKKAQEVTQSTEKFLKDADKLNVEIKRQRDLSRNKPWLEAQTLFKGREGTRQASPQPRPVPQQQEAPRKLVKRKRGVREESLPTTPGLITQRRRQGFRQARAVPHSLSQLVLQNERLGPRGIRVIRQQTVAPSLESELLAIATRDRCAARDILRGIGRHLEASNTEEIKGIVHFLKIGGNPRALAVTLGNSVSFGTSDLLDALRTFNYLTKADAKGISVILRWCGTGAKAADRIIGIGYNYQKNARAVYGALNEVAPVTDRGLNEVIRDLAMVGTQKDKGALGVLLSARDLLRQNPGARLEFELPVSVKAGKEYLGRIFDIKLKLPKNKSLSYLSVEVKELEKLSYLNNDSVMIEFIKDVLWHVKNPPPPPFHFFARLRWRVKRPKEGLNSAELEVRKQQAKRIFRRALDGQYLKRNKDPRYPKLLQELMKHPEYQRTLKEFDIYFAKFFDFF